VSASIPLEELQANAQQAKLVYASPFLERVLLLDGEETYECPWDLVPLFRGKYPYYRITVADWSAPSWCEQGCNHCWVYATRRGSPQDLKARVTGRWTLAVLEGPSVRFYIYLHKKAGYYSPWRG
jgi:hypothetical protein